MAGGLGSLLVAPSRPSGFLLTLQQADGRHRAVAARLLWHHWLHHTKRATMDPA